MARYAVVENGVVTNVIEWEGPEVEPIDWPDGWLVILPPEGVVVNIGFLYQDGVFINPNPPPEDGSTEEK